MKQIMFAALAFLFIEVGLQVEKFPVQQIGNNLVAASAQLDADLKEVPSTFNRANTTLDKLPSVVSRINGTLDNINRPCGQKVAGKFMPCGPIANLNETLNASKRTLTLVNIAVRHEDNNLNKFDTIADDLHDNLQSSNKLVSSITPRLNDLIEQSSKAVSNPDIPKTLHNVQGMTDSGNILLKDGSDKFHQLVHPNKKKLTFWGAVDATTMWLHKHVEPPLF